MDRWTAYTDRYQQGEWRAPVFRDMVLDDLQAQGGRPTVLDIGCGGGFDGSGPLQRTIADAAGAYIGVEPDPVVTLDDRFTEVHRCLFEDAPLRPGSVDLAFAVMVLEHLAEPERFWAKLQEVLAPGGVFWGFTMDARHWFASASRWFDRLRVKDLYLTWLRGRRGVERYANYPVHYRANRPEQLAAQLEGFGSVECVGFARPGQLDYYLPRLLRPTFAWLDRRAIARGRPGTLLAVRATKIPSAHPEPHGAFACPAPLHAAGCSHPS
jgi:SAM-dependent methyltransferase